MGRKFAQFGLQALALLGVLLLLGQFVVFVVDQREQAVVLRFGNPVRSATEPGLYFKAPFVESVRIIPATLQFWGDSDSDLLPDLPTKDDKKIELIPWAVWRVNDPIAFVQRMRTMEKAEERVAQFVRGAMRDVITQYDLSELVRSTDRKMQTARLEIVKDELKIPEAALPGAAKLLPEDEANKKVTVGRQTILGKIKAEAHRRLEATDDGVASGARGIELVDLGISHIDFVSSVRKKTFERWIAERDAISTRNIKEGERLKQEILNMTNAEVERIQGDGQRTASETRGKADAEVIKRYADAIGEVGEFYTFVRTLEAYEKSLSKQTQLILTTDNEFLRQLRQLEKPASRTVPSTTAAANP